MTMTQTLPAAPAAAARRAEPTARDLMSPVDNVIGEDGTLGDVVRRFLDGSGRHLIVLDRDGRCSGVIGPRHIAQARRLDPRRDEEIPISELGCAPWIALSPLDSARTCAQMLVEYDLDAIPVLDGDQRVLGLVTAHDIVRAAADVPRRRTAHVSD
ncbi:CBS domain-containing protein [Actinospica sp. MGRD01-02]|uniref:CBS domain-containing protein n=1 Tax=Actinospica acidithermotolerans TaxID=2828514 RepID=A0A941EEK9_9ACTN|nr:CBS domain-containing protein [Actinospica acidithermotolerans]MBR7831260.1 CBS domain-containing protein [Actinospica acidithermotolerans]